MSKSEATLQHQQPVAGEGNYYAAGLTVFQKPRRNPKTGNMAMGFPVCQASEHVPGAAKALNFVDRIAAEKQSGAALLEQYIEIARIIGADE